MIRTMALVVAASVLVSCATGGAGVPTSKFTDHESGENLDDRRFSQADDGQHAAKSAKEFPTSQLRGTPAGGGKASERASMIAFVHSDKGDDHEDEERGNREIYLMDLEGGNLTRLTDNPANDTEPCWSPDAASLAFASDRDGNSEIYAMTLATGKLTRLTNDAAEDFQPSWSPDGKSIAFVSTRNEKNYDIWVMNADGTAPRRVTTGKGMEAFPTWSPDGKSLAYSQTNPEDKTGKDWDVYTVELKEGAEPRRVTKSKSLEFAPMWHPDGGRILYMSFREGNEDLYAMNLKDGAEQRLTKEPSAEDHVSISPDGKSLVFMCVTMTEGKEKHEIVRMNLDGTGLKKLTSHAGSDFHPRWSPAPVPLDVLRRYVAPAPAK